MDALDSGMHYLVTETRMVSGLSVTFGTAREAETRMLGLAQEVRLENGRLLSDPKPLQADNLYDLASLTKCFTAVLALQLIAEGRLDPSAAPSAYDPRFTFLDRVPVMDILTFSAGLITPGRVDSFSDPSEGLKCLFQIAPCEPPPVRLYSDMHAMVIARILEAIENRSYMDILQKRILAPAGMKETGPLPEPGRCLNYCLEHRVSNGMVRIVEGPVPGQVHDPKAALLQPAVLTCCGHAGLFSSRQDMQRFAQALLSGELLPRESLCSWGINRTGRQNPDGTYRQFLGILCFSKHPVQHFSEMPVWMGTRGIGYSGFTGNTLALDPDTGTFVLYLGNRVHNRLTRIEPNTPDAYQAAGLSEEGVGLTSFKDVTPIPSSVRYVYFKDKCLSNPIGDLMRERGWLPPSE